MPILSAFTNEFEAQLARSQYTRWVLDRGFAEDNMLALLSMIGEFDVYATRLFRPLFDDWSNLRGYHRPICALEGLHQIVRGERFNRDGWAKCKNHNKNSVAPRPGLEPGTCKRCILLIDCEFVGFFANRAMGFNLFSIAASYQMIWRLLPLVSDGASPPNRLMAIAADFLRLQRSILARVGDAAKKGLEKIQYSPARVRQFDAAMRANTSD